MQIRDARHVLAAAAEFSDVMGERGARDQRGIDRKPRFSRLLRGVARHMPHAEGMPRGVKRHDLFSDAQQFAVIAFSHRLGKEHALLLHGAFVQLLLRNGQVV